MSQISGPGDQIYSLVGEGIVYLAPKGTALADIPDEATDYHVISWEANENVEEKMVTNTGDFNATTKQMNPRGINVSSRIEGTLKFHHNADPALDILKNTVPGEYYAIQMFITQGQLAGTSIPAIHRCYFWIQEANLGSRNLGGGDVNDPRPVDISFKSNGVYLYTNEAVPAPPGP